MKKKSIQNYVESFSNHVGDAISSIEAAAKCYAEAIKIYADAAQVEFENKYPHVSANTWNKFLAVGNGDLNPSAMLLSDKFCKKISRMPKSVQDQVLNGDSFVVFNPTTRKAEAINYGSLKPRHEKILFDDENLHVRSIPEQVAYSNLLAKEKIEAAKKYTVHTDRLEVHCACDIGRGELESILEEME